MRKTHVSIGVALLFLIVGIQGVFAQKEANNWYFGNKGAFHFNTPSGNPVAISTSSMNAFEGCSSMSDRTTGGLLFYTDGTSVWNRNNLVMPNGTGLQGHSSSSHSSVVIPMPGSTTKYYIFTVPTSPNIGAKYSVLDMSLASGFGDVVSTQKNVQLAQSPTNSTTYPVADKCAAIAHSNGRDYWVVVQHNTTWSLYAYLVTSTGVSNSPVISTVVAPGSFGSIPHYGCMKFSTDGKMLAAAYNSRSAVLLWDFNDRTGAFTNQISVTGVGTSFWTRPYGLEFSPDSKLLYVNASGGVDQWDPHAGTAAQIYSSSTKISPTQYTNAAGQLQIGPDQKIYWVKNTLTNSNVVSRIDSPNVVGTGCAFRDTGVVLSSGAVGRLGLPTFVQSFFNTTTLSVEDACDSQYVKIAVKDTSAVDSVQYFYGDSLSAHKSSWNKLDSHLFSGPGKYEVIAYAYYYDSKNKKTVIDTLRDTVEILQIPKVVLPGDTTICISDSLQAVIQNSQWSSPYQLWWQDSTTNPWFTIDSVGKFYAWASNRCGVGSDTIVVDSLFKREIDLGNDTVFCFGDSVKLDISDTNATYLWSTGETTPVIYVDTSQVQLWGRSSNMCGTYYDTMNLTAIVPPKVEVVDDTSFCINHQRNLWVGEKSRSAYSSYYWNGQLGGHQKLIFNTGWYEILETNLCGSDIDSIWVVKAFPLNPDLGQDTILCPGDSIFLDPYTAYADCIWNNDGSLTDSTFTIKSPGTYWVAATNRCGVFRDSITVAERNAPVVSLPGDTIICQGDSVTLEVAFPHATYRWMDGRTVSRIWGRTTGWHWVETKTVCGSDLDSIYIQADAPVQVTLPDDTVICDSDQYEIEVLAQNARSFQWSTGNVNAKQLITKGGVYSVTATNVCGNVSDDITIEALRRAIPNLGPDTVICDGDGIELRTHIEPEILDYSIVVWDDKYTAKEFYVERARRYMVQVTNDCGSARDTIEVELQKSPFIPRLNDTVVCDNVVRYDFSDLGYQFLWSDGSRGTEIAIAQAGEYSVEMWDELGCYNSQRFDVRQCASKMWVPKAFSPNKDGINEYFRVYKDGITYFQIEIYDRWNKQVFSTNDINEGWDGTVRNNGSNDCPIGQYVYKITFIEKENNQTQVVTGEVTLVR